MAAGTINSKQYHMNEKIENERADERANERANERKSIKVRRDAAVEQIMKEAKNIPD
jgi:hypothetical protein